MAILIGVIALFAVLSLALAVAQGVAMVRVAPAGAQLGSFMPLGWWKFDRIAEKAGPAAVSHLAIYKRAVVAFLVFIVLGLILSGFATSQAPAQTTASLAPSLTDARIIPAQFAANFELRRVATMPGAAILES
ncbi:hypothetical protein WH87_03610 [Devosia epidermidihirudinis]|uniref:Uncharacterized protein n=1 Tax=Devosia epidermidihirudinis TaxID=1293439 RepID=A0A0F5QH19_9HYPH|nr:hypothetical protein [Devosia epidermidihirudinis]KKC39319.1 hypothetical protein WH87_03610 [Devosia epidermidihirudinis]